MADHDRLTVNVGGTTARRLPGCHPAYVLFGAKFIAPIVTEYLRRYAEVNASTSSPCSARMLPAATSSAA
jgi:hypothetical protein